VPLLPLTLHGERPGLRLAPPRLGEHTRELLAQVGYSAVQIEALLAQHVIGATP
jgi:crotonobetainyl-CoA:carnitine CoA-transferase CaiB-like acyl-CoA transferase